MSRLGSTLRAIAVDYGRRPLVSPARLLRILGWTALFAALAVRLLPEDYRRIPPRSLRAAAPPEVHVMGGEDDEIGRWYTVPPREPDEFRIAWIGGSSNLVVSAEGEPRALLTGMVRSRLARRTGRRVVLLAYPLIAGAVYDKYVAFLHALDQEPDLIVFSVNPTWDFSPLIRTWRQNLRPVALGHLPADRVAVGEFLLLAAPRDLPTAALLALYPNLYGTALTLHRRVVDPIERELLSVGRTGREVALPFKPQRMKMDFWLIYDDGHTPGSHLDRQRFMMEHHFTLDPNSTGPRLLRSIKRLAAERAKPLLVYTDPLNPALLHSPRVRECLGAIDRLLEDLGANAATTPIVVWNFNHHDLLREADFYDGIHLVAGDRFADALATGLQNAFPALRSSPAAPGAVPP